MNRRVALGLGATLLAIAGTVSAWIANTGPLWPDGNVTLHLQLGNSPTYSDGTNPNSTALAAIEQWNPYIGRVQLVGKIGSSAAKKQDNGINNVFFSDKIYDREFGAKVLAVALIKHSSNRRTETDVVVNTAFSWDAYRDSLHHSRPDLRRVLAHEFGHVLGLGHPDEVGQYQHALMNSHISSVDATTQDDQDGVASLYGRGIANPAMPPTFAIDEPYDQIVDYGHSAWFNAFVQGSEPLSYQWKKNGVPILGATLASLQILSARTSDAGKYSVSVSNEAGSATSREAVLTVNPAQPPHIYSEYPSDQTATVGQSVQLGIYFTGSPPFTYQWRKNGLDLPGATEQYLVFDTVTLANAGRYSVRVSNDVGFATSREAILAVDPVRSSTSSHMESISTFSHTKPGTTTSSTCPASTSQTARSPPTSPTTICWARVSRSMRRTESCSAVHPEVPPVSARSRSLVMACSA